LDSYTRAPLVSQGRRHLFVTFYGTWHSDTCSERVAAAVAYVTGTQVAAGHPVTGVAGWAHPAPPRSLKRTRGTWMKYLHYRNVYRSNYLFCVLCSPVSIPMKKSVLAKCVHGVQAVVNRRKKKCAFFYSKAKINRVCICCCIGNIVRAGFVTKRCSDLEVRLFKIYFLRCWAAANSAWLICPSSRYFQPTPCFDHRVDAKVPVFTVGTVKSPLVCLQEYILFRAAEGQTPCL
jgi:hypothetical protein